MCAAGELKQCMKILDLNNNCLAEFPAALEQLARLEELNINSNKISKVSIQVCQNSPTRPGKEL